MEAMPKAGETWVSVDRRRSRVEYLVLAVACHTERYVAGRGAEQLVVFRAAYGQHADPANAWATPAESFVRQFRLEPAPRHPEPVEDAKQLLDGLHQGR